MDMATSADPYQNLALNGTGALVRNMIDLSLLVPAVHFIDGKIDPALTATKDHIHIFIQESL